MAFLIDTNIAIHARVGHAAVLGKLASHRGAVLISALSLAEMHRGLYKKPIYALTRKSRLDVLLRFIAVLPFDTGAAEAYGLLIAQCGWARGRDVDWMIAAHAISTNSVLVTNNLSDFRDIPGLTIQDWTLAT